jgi:hypothetical protein
MRLARNVLLVSIYLVAAAWGASRQPRVSFELLTQPGLSLTASQQWYKALTGLGLSGLQIRAAGPRDEMGVTRLGSEATPEYKVVGLLAGDNTLRLPGGKFSLNDTARLRKWLDNLRDDGAEGVTERRSAFGLIPRQLEQVHDDLKKPVGISTRGISADKAVAQIGGSLKWSLEPDEATRRELSGLHVTEEFSGLSSGTALAAILRPVGLVLEPQRSPAGNLRYRIGKPESGHDAWPIGWKPKEKPNKVLGDLFEFLNVEIQEIPVSEALEAIEGRLKVPFVFDRAAMALHGVDPAKVEADVPGKRMTYSQVLNKVLMQARLKYELRVDEAEKPFLWITTVKPTP